MTNGPIVINNAVVVITGAGASYDLIPPHQINVVKDLHFKPPLTQSLFNMPSEFEPLLELYPQAYSAIGAFRYAIYRGQKSVETLLKELKDSEEETKISQFKQLPLYFQSLFTRISDGYCRMPVNYTTLITETLRKKVDAVAYVTLNYDLFLEKALKALTGFAFNGINQYIPENRKWMLIKLHGSANWGRKLKKILNPGEQIDALLDCIDRSDLENDLESEIEVNPFEWNQGGTSINKYYPALTVPVDNKYEFNCPQEHIEKLKSLLKICKKFLIIGVSGKDKDLLELLSQNVGEVNKVTIVGGETVDGDKTRFKEGVPQFNKPAVGWVSYNKGFSEFIKADGIESFLEG